MKKTVGDVLWLIGLVLAVTVWFPDARQAGYPWQIKLVMCLVGLAVAGLGGLLKQRAR